jgi:hypothetical protein
MSTFIVRIELHPADPAQAYSEVHDAMTAAGFSRIFRDHDGVRYHLPASEYCLASANSVEAIRDLAAAAVTKVTTLFMLLVSETTKIAIAGLVPVNDVTRPVALGPQPSAVTKAA